MFFKKNVLNTTLLALLCAGCDPSVHTARTFRGVLPEARDQRPLLVIMAQFSDESFKSNHTSDYFDGMFYTGVGYPNGMNIHGYFYEASLGEFSFTKAENIPIVTLKDDPSTANVDESLKTCSFGDQALCPGSTQNDRTLRNRIIRQAAEDAGVDFSVYDENSDGYVDMHELTILMIDAAPRSNTGAAARPPVNGCESVRAPGRPSVQVCGLIPGMTEHAAFASAAHELAHTLGAIDLYGPNCLGLHQTLMSCTLFPQADYAYSIYLDPWHRAELGWQMPRAIQLDPAATSGLSEAEFIISADPGGPIAERPFGIQSEPVVVSIKGDEINRALMIEFRNPNAGISPYDKDTRAGINVWYVELDEIGYPANKLTATGGHYFGVYPLTGTNWSSGTAVWSSGNKEDAENFLTLLESAYGFKLELLGPDRPGQSGFPFELIELSFKVTTRLPVIQSAASPITATQ